MTGLVVIGGGRMGEALAAGLIAAGRTPSDLAITELDPSRREELISAHPGVEVTAEMPATRAAVIAVKPPDAPMAAAAASAAGARRVLSVAAGVPIAALEAAVDEGTAVIRAMPNTPALVGAGASAVAAGTSAGDDDVAWAEDVLGAVGTVVRVTEGQLDAVTGLSGSGPAYVFLLAEAMIDAGVLAGLPRPTSKDLVVRTILGAARLLVETAEEPSRLRADVTSPGGTTAVGLRTLEDGGMRAAVLAAVEAAAERSRRLGEG